MSKISTYSLADEPLQLSDRLIGTEAPRPIPSATPLATKNFSLGELLQLFSSEFPAASLQAVLDTGNTATQDITLTGTITTSVIKPDEIEDVLGSQGDTFQFLSKAANGINWVDLPLSTPTLDEVLAEGNISQRFAKVGGIYLYDGLFNDYSSILMKSRRFVFTNDLGQQYLSIFQDTISLRDSVFLYSFNIKKPSTLSNNHTAFFQDTSGTIAYLQDIPNEITLTTIGSTGPATLIGDTLNIPNYSGGSVPTLDEVLDEGNTSELNANIGELGLYDSFNSQYYKIVANDELFKFKNNLGSNIFIVGYSEFSLFNGTGTIAANFSSALLTITRNFQFPNASGTIALTSDIPSLLGYVPYIGAVSSVNLGNNDLYVNEIFLYDGPNDNYGTIHFTDGNFHIEDADGHPLFVVEDGFLQIHKDATIQSNLWTTDLTAIRDHYLPNESGTIALTSNIPLVDAVPTDGSTNAVSSNGVFDALATKQNSLGFTPYRYINTAQSVGSNASGETQLIRVTIPANSFAASDKFYFRLGFSKVGTANGITLRAKLTTSASMPSGTTSQIATATMGNTALYGPVERNMAINGGNLKGFNFTGANVTDGGTATNAWSSVAFDVTQTQYFYVSVVPAALTTDVTYLEYIEISNI
jgi:hypothetical protein